MDTHILDRTKGHEWEVIRKYMHEQTLTVVYECTKCRLRTVTGGLREIQQFDFGLTCMELYIKNFLDE